MIPYRYTPYELELLKRLSFNVFKKSKHFDFDRYPEIFWVEEYSRTKSFQSDKEWHDTSPKDEESNIEYDRNYNIDLLGCYIYNNQKNHIELYGPRIRESTELISYYLGLSYDLTMELLQAIVLIHEIGHWFSHDCFIELRQNRMESFQYSDSSIKETIAQLCVIWSTLGMRDKKTLELLKIMDFLTSRQPFPYRQYLKLSKDYNKKNRILNRYINILDSWDYDLDYLLLNTKTLIPSIRLNSK